MAKFRIVMGPAKVDFVTRYFDRDLQRLKPFRLTLQQQTETPVEFDIEVILNGVTYEDGSGESWNLSGHVTGHPAQAQKPLAHSLVLKIGTNFKGYYQTTHRSGWLNLT